eukprot:m.189375 g.189375  ORF g.189375 m.189375 type:complete len:109 (+) comp10034_c0_seq1:148-474(+)
MIPSDAMQESVAVRVGLTHSKSVADKELQHVNANLGILVSFENETHERHMFCSRERSWAGSGIQQCLKRLGRRRTDSKHERRHRSKASGTSAGRRRGKSVRARTVSKE